MSDEPHHDEAEAGVTTVTTDGDESEDGGGGGGGGDVTDPPLSYEDAAAENARVQAEARRRRILEKADKRLGVVSGEQPLEEGEKKSSASHAARIRAARARRYGKKGAAGETTAAGAAVPESPPPAAAAGETTAPPGGEEEEEEAVVASPTGAAVPVPGPTETPVAKESAGEQEPASKKKYLGVAKMRRKMIAQKKLEEAEGSPAGGATTETGSAGPQMAVGLTKKTAVLPVYMHIATVLLLFVAGFDVGIQQFHEDVQIHTQTAVQEFGIPFVHRKPWQPLAPLSSSSHGKGEEATAKFPWREDASQQRKVLDSHPNVDEFNDIGTDEEYVPNIDPIFGMDLDELTKGPGVVNQLARGAVTIHRMILGLVYFAPLSIFKKLISIPIAMLQMPPVLFVIAILLRQVVGKAMLGAAIPEPASDGSSDGGSNIEVISMAKNFVKNFMATTFPRLVAFYDAFTHLRSDMYIVVCGVFCGLAWTHLYPPGLGPIAAEGGTDEL